MIYRSFEIHNSVWPKLMMLWLTVLLFVSPIEGQAKWTANKKAVVASVKKHEKELTSISDNIWSYAELSLVEHQSSKVLSDYAEKNGFKVERGVAGMPTAIVATYGSGRPHIGILGEFDANAGISQKNSPRKKQELQVLRDTAVAIIFSEPAASVPPLQLRNLWKKETEGYGHLFWHTC